MDRPQGNPTGELDFFLKHVVPIYLLFERDGQYHQAIFTSFVMSIENVWFLMTAGHCIDDVNANKRKGAVIRSAKLLDALRKDAKHKLPIPFDYEQSGAARICYDETYDYGGIVVDSYYRRLLVANGVEPITERAWARQPKDFDFYKVMGVNYARSQFTPDRALVTITSHRVRKLRRRPAQFKPTTAPTLWGKVSLDHQGTSIQGLSGGPVFGFAKRGDQLKYWLHAVQSRWREDTRQIAACEMRPLGIFLKDFMQGKHGHLSESPDADAHVRAADAA